MRYRDKETDNRLMEMIASGSPQIEEIKKVLKEGADINSTNIEGTVLMESIWLTERGLDLSIIHKLVELGADIHYQDEDGYTALSEACNVHNVELVDFLLRAGANPNIILEKHKSLLNDVETDISAYEMGFRQESDDSEDVQTDRLKRIAQLLVEHGAKTYSEIFTDRVETWLQVFASDVAGLCTRTGHITIDQIPGVPVSLAAEFRSWHASNWDPWPKEGVMPPMGFDRAAHNNQGMRLCKSIKMILGTAIEVSYLCIDSEYEKAGRRNVDDQVIA